MVLGYMTLLCLGAMIAPGVGLSGRLLVQIPWDLLDWAHAPAFGLLAWLLSRELVWRGWPLFYAVAVASATALVFGLWTEVFQGSVPGRQPSGEDLINDAMGIACAVMLIVVQKGQPSLLAVPAPTCQASSCIEQEEETAADAVSFR